MTNLETINVTSQRQANVAVVCVTTIAVTGDILIRGHQLEAALPTIT